MDNRGFSMASLAYYGLTGVLCLLLVAAIVRIAQDKEIITQLKQERFATLPVLKIDEVKLDKDGTRCLVANYGNNTAMQCEWPTKRK